MQKPEWVLLHHWADENGNPLYMLRGKIKGLFATPDVTSDRKSTTYGYCLNESGFERAVRFGDLVNYEAGPIFVGNYTPSDEYVWDYTNNILEPAYIDFSEWIREASIACSGKFYLFFGILGYRPSAIFSSMKMALRWIRRYRLCGHVAAYEPWEFLPTKKWSFMDGNRVEPYD